ncbi:MAG: Betaine-aldehyde dehydrogenase [Ilumatobacteraceae bacterium]|nr:Betaine-aldehyde dehydrogenase [Ilumatobacteraceae bacterium]
MSLVTTVLEQPMPMTIDGRAVLTTATFSVINPATGAVFASAPECTAEQLDDAFQAAEKAFRTWRRDDALRCRSLLAAAVAIVAALDPLCAILTAEQGKPLNQAALEIHQMAAWLRYYAGLELPRQIIQDDDSVFAEVVRRPLGVVAAITPWNFPISLAAFKIAPALRAGNTIVLKPSPYTPLATLMLGQILRDVLPAGVLNVITGGDHLGSWMTTHSVPRKVSFTGSTATGMKVAAAAAADLKRITLELGGNDPAIILDDAKPSEIAPRLFRAAFANSGQVCSAIKRIYVPESLHDELVDELAAQARAYTVGDGSLPGVHFGPLNNRAQFERVSSLVAEALDNGATAAAGGHEMPGPGYFFELTVLAGLSDGARIVDEEQFGPALPVIAYTDIDDAVARANASHFGLGGSVWGTDVERAIAVADKLECGTSWVNAHLQLAPQRPFGGAKWSGLGVENGPWGYYSYTEMKLQYTAKS